MSKKDYERIAEFLFNRFLLMRGTGERETGFRIAVSAVEDALAADNARFNRTTFRRACGLEVNDE